MLLTVNYEILFTVYVSVFNSSGNRKLTRPL
jgi:hypothetical protein